MSPSRLKAWPTPSASIWYCSGDAVRILSLQRALVVLCVLGLAVVAAATKRQPLEIGASEIDAIRGLWIGGLEPLPPDDTNHVGDDPDAADLGHRIFYDSRFSADGSVACATCHVPELNFTDGLPLSRGVGDVPRKSMTITGTAHSPWLFWDGRKDSLWAQALAPLESPVEHGIDRGTVAHLVRTHYGERYEALFGPLPDLTDAQRFPTPAGPVDDPAARRNWERMRTEDRDAVTGVFVNVGKAIAAFERQIMPGPSPFDRFAEALLQGDHPRARAALDDDQIAGLRLFIGGANCIDCHNGPLFTNNAFHNTGVPPRPGLPDDPGRAAGAAAVLADEFNCLSGFSDADAASCEELRFLKVDGGQLERAFKPPTLRNVAEAGPYMHAGQFGTLREVVDHYVLAPAAVAGHSELEPLPLTERERGQLEAFLRSLSGPLLAPARYLRPPDDGGSPSAP
jgi:cytochrome c peroxidase